MTKQVAILSAAQTLFSRFGLKKVTTDEIAREARVSKATLYKLYRNKGEIFDEVVKIESEQLLEAIREAVEKETTVAAKFKAHLLTKLAKIRELINLYKVTYEPAEDVWPHLAEARERVMIEEKKIVLSILREGHRRKEVSVKNIETVAQIMVISLQSQEQAWVTDRFKLSLESYVDMMIDIMINGIKRKSVRNSNHVRLT